jgi:ketosteroid isomerase-like protein
MKNRVSLLLAAIGLAVMHVGCRPSAPESDLKAINTLQRQVDSAIMAGDTESYVALIADDAVLMPPNAPPVIGKDAIRSWNQVMSQRFRMQAYKPLNDEVILAGKWAFRRATADWTLVPVAGGEPMHDSGKFIIIYERQANGSWRVARDIWNSNTQAP